jgi:xylulokinase
MSAEDLLAVAAQPLGKSRSGMVLSIDVGSTAVKSALVAEDGSLHHLSEAIVPQGASGDGFRTQRVTDLLASLERAVISTISDSSFQPIEAISVTGPRGSVAVMGSAEESITDVISWQDARAAPIAVELSGRVDMSAYRGITGMNVQASSVLPKLVWLKRFAPKTLEEARHLATPQSLVMHVLGADNYPLEPSVAAHFGTFNIHSLAWDKTLTAHFGISPSLLPMVVPSGTVVGHTTGGFCGRASLPSGIPIVAAGSDGLCAELGAGVYDPGQIYGYLGTATAVAGPVERHGEPISTHDLILMPGRDARHFRLLGLGSAGGSAADWAAGILGCHDAAELVSLAAESVPGSHGVRFLPTLAGAAAPFPNPQARACLMGAHLATSRGDIARAVLEGVAAEITIFLEAMSSEGIVPEEMRLAGGGARSRMWAQIIADMANIPVVLPRVAHSGLVGAAWYARDATLGREGLGRYVGRPESSGALQPRTSEEYASVVDDYRRIRGMMAAVGMDARLARSTEIAE